MIKHPISHLYINTFMPAQPYSFMLLHKCYTKLPERIKNKDEQTKSFLKCKQKQKQHFRAATTIKLIANMAFFTHTHTFLHT